MDNQMPRNVCSTANAKLTIQSSTILLSEKFNTKTRNNCNRYLKQISVKIVLKQLHYWLRIFDSASGLTNYHLVEIES